MTSSTTLEGKGFPWVETFDFSESQVPDISWGLINRGVEGWSGRFVSSDLEGAFMITLFNDHRITLVWIFLIVLGLFAQIGISSTLIYLFVVGFMGCLGCAVALLLSLKFASKATTRSRIDEMCYIIPGLLTINLFAITAYSQRADCIEENVNGDLGYSFCAYDFTTGVATALVCIGVIFTRRIGFMISIGFGAISLLIGFWLVLPFTNGEERYVDLPTDYLVLDIIFTLLFTAPILMIQSLREKMMRRKFLDSLDLYLSQDSATRNSLGVRRVVKALLPTSVLRRVAAGESVVDQDVASVLIADLVNFTAWCASRRTPEVVRMLSLVVAKLDYAAIKTGVQKVKTIGDAYWTVCNVPDTKIDHTIRTVKFGLLIHRIVARLSSSGEFGVLQFRAGIHVGRVLGTVLGQRFSYEIYGMVTQVAEELETNCNPEGISISGEGMSSLMHQEDLLHKEELQRRADLESAQSARTAENSRPATSSTSISDDSASNSPETKKRILSGLFTKDSVLEHNLPGVGDIDMWILKPAVAQRNLTPSASLDLSGTFDSSLNMEFASHSLEDDMEVIKLQISEQQEARRVQRNDNHPGEDLANGEQQRLKIETGGRKVHEQSRQGVFIKLEDTRRRFLLGYSDLTVQSDFLAYRRTQTYYTTTVSLGFLFVFYVFYLVVLLVEDLDSTKLIVPALTVHSVASAISLVLLLLWIHHGRASSSQSASPMSQSLEIVVMLAAFLATFMTIVMTAAVNLHIPGEKPNYAMPSVTPFGIAGALVFGHGGLPGLPSQILVILNSIIAVGFTYAFYDFWLDTTAVFLFLAILLPVGLFIRERNFQQNFEMKRAAELAEEKSKEEQKVLFDVISVTMPPHMVPHLMANFAKEEDDDELRPSSKQKEERMTLEQDWALDEDNASNDRPHSASDQDDEMEMAVKKSMNISTYLQNVAVIFVSVDLNKFLTEEGGVNDEEKYAESMKQSMTLIEGVLSNRPEFTLIKTVGNVLLIAGPLDHETKHSAPFSSDRSTPADSCKKALMLIQQLVERAFEAFRQSVRLRVGLHIGPLNAAVIGRRQLIYDIFGTTVNIASRVMTTQKIAKSPDDSSSSRKISCIACSADVAEMLISSSASAGQRTQPQEGVTEVFLGSSALGENMYAVISNEAKSVFGKGVGVMRVNDIRFSKRLDY